MNISNLVQSTISSLSPLLKNVGLGEGQQQNINSNESTLVQLARQNPNIAESLGISASLLAKPLGNSNNPSQSQTIRKNEIEEPALQNKKTAEESGKNVILKTQSEVEGKIKIVTETRSGGSRAWRNNNPGNMRTTAFTEQRGSIGSAGGFAVFPDEATGQKALIALLKTKTYQSLSIEDAINRYAPPSENDTTNYQSLLKKATGLEGNTLLGALNDEQLNSVANAIKSIEGFIEGKVEVVESYPNKI